MTCVRRAAVLAAVLLAACAGGAAPDPKDAGAPDSADAAVEIDSGTADAGMGPIRQLYGVAYLVSNGVPDAGQTDPTLVNAYGLCAATMGPLWSAAKETDTIRAYGPTGVPASAPVTLRPSSGKPAEPALPTGIACNGQQSFMGDAVIVATDTGVIEGWPQGAAQTTIRVDNSNALAVYKALALARTANGDRLYATNFRAGNVEMYDGTYKLLGTFTDTMPPTGYAPFNVTVIEGSLYVTFAKQDGNQRDEVPGAGNGFVDVFDLTGKLQTRLLSGGALNAPYGIAHSPVDFGRFADVLLVANVGDGRINVFDPNYGDVLGSLEMPGFSSISIDGLHAILFGNDRGAGPHNTLFFTAGPNGGANGVLGSIVPVAQ
jgi:uncharacterized protein (TIGR03118 family)